MSGINTYYDITTTVSSEVGWGTAWRNKRTSTVRLDIVSNRPPSSPDSNLSYSFVHKKKKKNAFICNAVSHCIKICASIGSRRGKNYYPYLASIVLRYRRISDETI